MRRQLVLKKDTLTDLTPRELGLVAGGASTDCIDPPTDICIQSYDVLCFLSRAMVNCPTEQTFVC